MRFSLLHVAKIGCTTLSIANTHPFVFYLSAATTIVTSSVSGGNNENPTQMYQHFYVTFVSGGVNSANSVGFRLDWEIVSPKTGASVPTDANDSMLRCCQYKNICPYPGEDIPYSFDETKQIKWW